VVQVYADLYSWVSWHKIILTMVTLVLCGLIVALARLAPKLTGVVGHLNAVQAMHSRPTPRIGGLAIFVGLVTSILFAPFAISAHYQHLLMGTGVLFAVGLAEDMGLNVSARSRLLAACGASLVVMLLVGAWMPRTDIFWLDPMMSHWVVGVPLTLLITAGVANGFNLIDGVNGLASLTGVVAAVAMACIAGLADYLPMVKLTLMLAAIVLGFFLWNFPFGHIFLGDAGAYTIGFILSWFAISILINVPTVSPWALLLTLFWPVADTVLAIWRRAGRKASTMAPDRLHVHQLVMRALEIHVLGRGRRQFANPLTTVLLAPFIIGPAIAGVVFWNNSLSAFLAVLAFTAIFFASYVIAFSVRPHLPRFRQKGLSIRKGRASDVGQIVLVQDPTNAIYPKIGMPGE
jgi:UDP-N-acetylmuramyl pentapeptide phosphotransferase/UDP-N-acetylglucosamine-1-phosphate transferase